MKNIILLGLCVGIAVMSNGCACKMTNPYVMETNRQDQAMDTGNRGYIKGTPPSAADRTNVKRQFLAVDVDLPGMSEGQTHWAGSGKKSAAPQKNASASSDVKNIAQGSDLKASKDENIK